MSLGGRRCEAAVAEENIKMKGLLQYAPCFLWTMDFVLGASLPLSLDPVGHHTAQTGGGPHDQRTHVKTNPLLTPAVAPPPPYLPAGNFFPTCQDYPGDGSCLGLKGTLFTSVPMTTEVDHGYTIAKGTYNVRLGGGEV